jgi:hypothetical protein
MNKHIFRVDVDPACEPMDFDDPSYNYFDRPFKTEPAPFDDDNDNDNNDEDQYFRQEGQQVSIESENAFKPTNGEQMRILRLILF